MDMRLCVQVQNALLFLWAATAKGSASGVCDAK
jgi:hypothetical protein